jgi:hypothetical protein
MVFVICTPKHKTGITFDRTGIAFRPPPFPDGLRYTGEMPTPQGVEPGD